MVLELPHASCVVWWCVCGGLVGGVVGKGYSDLMAEGKTRQKDKEGNQPAHRRARGRKEETRVRVDAARAWWEESAVVVLFIPHTHTHLSKNGPRRTGTFFRRFFERFHAHFWRKPERLGRQHSPAAPFLLSFVVVQLLFFWLVVFSYRSFGGCGL